jgi:hypothetical protein
MNRREWIWFRKWENVYNGEEIGKSLTLSPTHFQTMQFKGRKNPFPFLHSFPYTHMFDLQN